MTTVTLSTTAQTAQNINDYANGYFDAATHAAPQKFTGAYYAGYLNYTRQTGDAPF